MGKQKSLCAVRFTSVYSCLHQCVWCKNYWTLSDTSEHIGATWCSVSTQIHLNLTDLNVTTQKHLTGTWPLPVFFLKEYLWGVSEWFDIMSVMVICLRPCSKVKVISWKMFGMCISALKWLWKYSLLVWNLLSDNLQPCCVWRVPVKPTNTDPQVQTAAILDFSTAESVWTNFISLIIRI